jgi:hypothetical protein
MERGQGSGVKSQGGKTRLRVAGMKKGNPQMNADYSHGECKGKESGCRERRRNADIAGEFLM